MSAIKGTLKNKTSLGTVEMYPKTSIDQVENLTEALKTKGIHFVIGTSSQAGNKSSGKYLSTRWEAAIDGITAPFNGMTIAYRIQTNTGVSTAGAVLSLNGTSSTDNYHPVVFNINSTIGSRYGVNSTLVLTYNSTATATAYLTSNTATTVTGVWQVADYDSNTNTLLRTYRENGATDVDLPLLAGSIGTTTPSWTEPTAGSYKDLYGQVANDSTLTPKINLSTGALSAKSFKEDGTLLSAKYATVADLDTAVDLNSYSLGDVIPTATYNKLSTHATHIRALYSGRLYWVATSINDTTTGLTGIILLSIDASRDVEAIQTLVITKLPGATNYTLADIGAVDLPYYTSGKLTIKLNSSGKLTLKDTSEKIIDIYENPSQTSDINIYLPQSSGTLALLSDASVTSEKVISALGYTPYDEDNPEGYISGITATDVNTALGYIPYSASNPSGFISDYTVTQTDVTSALGYTPYSAANPAGYITGINSGDVTTALGYTPYNATNPAGYITGITGSDVTTALGYTPYNATNPENYVNANTTTLNNYYNKTQIDGMIAARFSAKIVQSLPTSGISTSTIYMIADTTLTDVYDEYMYIENAWVKIGSTSIDMSEYAKSADLANVAFTGAYTALVGRPTIPTKTSDLTNDSGFITSYVDDLQYYTKSSDLSTVATSGSYNDLLNKPTVPTTTSQLTNDSGYVTSAGLASVNISTFVNNVPYATMNDIQGLEEIDVDEIKKAIAAMEHIGTVTQVNAGTGLSGGGNTTVTLNHSNSVTAVTAWPSGTSTPENGGQFIVRDAKYDAQGHITGSQDRTITLPTIPIYDDTSVRSLITAEASARTATDGRVTNLESMSANEFTSFVFCIFGIEQYIDPSTMQPVPDRYYQRSDVDTGIFMDSEKIDIHLKAWLKYHYGIETQARMKNITCYVYALGDHGVYVNHMVTYWSQKTNTQISSYPHLLQTGCFIDDGYGSVHRFTTNEVGAILSSSDDGYIAADPAGTGKGYVSGWDTLTGRVTDLEDKIGDINDALDAINGEVI